MILMPELTVLFEDNHCLAVVKPAPLLTQGVPPGIPTLEAMVKNYLKAKYHKAGNVYLGIPHRLDRPVSGVILFARNSKAASRLAEQFEQRRVIKTYWGAVEGNVEPDTGTWTDWLRKIKEESRSERVEEGSEGARQAVLRYRRLQPCTGGCLVEFSPETGRMHQIRLQASLRGHPILGDEHYGARKAFGPAPIEPRERIIALHARSLTFLHPIRYEPITVTAPLPPVWRELGLGP
jgi:23S rRNA pseudouridine1911/1915/1917 synthase